MDRFLILLPHTGFVASVIFPKKGIFLADWSLLPGLSARFPTNSTEVSSVKTENCMIMVTGFLPPPAPKVKQCGSWESQSPKQSDRQLKWCPRARDWQPADRIPPASCFCEESFTETQTCSFIYVLCVEVFVLYWLSWVVSTETV